MFSTTPATGLIDCISSPPPGGREKDGILPLNFYNHCLLCLQHEDPSILQAIVRDNPKGLYSFQPILHFLTGTVDLSSWELNFGVGGGAARKYYPVAVASNLPPLCSLCYGILAELHIFYCELMELQRKIQNQTEAARRIAKGTMRRNGGMRREFFNRLKIARCPKKEIEGMAYFIGNFHALISEADRKAVLPQLLQLTFNDFTSSSPLSGTKYSTVLKPYYVQFTEPLVPKSGPNSPQDVTSASSSNSVPLPLTLNAPAQELSNSSLLLGIPEPLQTGPLNIPVRIPVISNKANDNNRVYMVTTPGVVQYEYEGEGDEVKGTEVHGQERGQVEDDDVLVLDADDEHNGEDIMLEEKTNVIVEQLEEELEGDNNAAGVDSISEDVEEEVEYWRKALSSQVIIEDAENEQGEDEEVEGHWQEEEEEEVIILEPPTKNRAIEVVDLDDDDDMEQMLEDEDFVNEGEDEEYTTQQPVSQFSTVQPLVLSVVSSSTNARRRLSSSTSEKGSMEPRFRCSFCHKGYHSLQKLRHHELEHLPGGRPKPFACQQCGRPFSSRTLLEQHERVHTGERPFPCNICGQRFRQGSTLYRHKKTHNKR